MSQPEFLPTTREEMTALGWEELDILLVSGDAYVDTHAFGVSLLGRWLLAHGFRAGIIAQPKWETTEDIVRMGRPRLFAGVTAGSVDSLLAHYTAFRKKRHDDAYSPGGAIGLRPNRATIAYTGLVRRAFAGLPVVAGGIEASLRRASHYDFWSDSLRRSILLDSKADAILYGMGEKSILALAELFTSTVARQRPAPAIARARIPGTVYAAHPDEIPGGAVELPSHEAILADPELLIKATMAFERQMLRAGPVLVQRSGGRVIVFEPPAAPLTGEEMDKVYGLPFTRRAHPSYTEAIPATAMLEGSVTSHRGCGGGCSFCALASHQGRLIQSRSGKSIENEVRTMASQPDWKGSITDIGGPSSNMWGAHCAGDAAACKRESCLYPKRCRYFKPAQEEQVALLRRVRDMDGVKHVRVASGVRHDLALESEEYLNALIGEFTGGQLKIAPEHIAEKTLRLMRKSPKRAWETFLKAFGKISEAAGKEQYIIPYLMSAFPGCTDQEMEELAAWLRRRGWRPQQVQCFIPTPGTVATAMFYSGRDIDGRAIPVARTDADRLRQHRILMPDAERPPAGERVERERVKRPPARRSGPEGGRKTDGFRKGPPGPFKRADARPHPAGRPGDAVKRGDGGGRRFEGGGGKPRTEGGRPRDGDWKPRGAGGMPRSDGGRPRNEGWKPRAEGGKPRGDGGRPRSEGWKPRGDGGRPRGDGGGGKPRFGGGRPRNDGGKPRGGGGKPRGPR